MLVVVAFEPETVCFVSTLVLLLGFGGYFDRFEVSSFHIDYT